MSNVDAARTGWALPVLLSITTTAALGFGFLYLTRPNAGELGAIRVVVSDDNGKTGNAIRVLVAEAPLAQKDVVSPGMAYTGTVHYPAPYLTLPNLKLTSGKRHYEVIAETELGFTWGARLLPDDLREGVAKDGNLLDKIFGSDAALTALKGSLKPGLVFEDFTWEAKGLRAPPSALPPKTFVQKGSFYSQLGQESVVFFEVPYDSPPNVELSSPVYSLHTSTLILECTEKSFRWRNTAKSGSSYGDVTWTAKGVRTRGEGK